MSVLAVPAPNRVRPVSTALAGGLALAGAAASLVDLRVSVLLAVLILGWTQLVGL